MSRDTVETKCISFEEMQEVCKHLSNDIECGNEDNMSQECTCSECPIWSDLKSTEVEY